MDFDLIVYWNGCLYLFEIIPVSIVAIVPHWVHCGEIVFLVCFL
jgi:hypothetical protein